MLILRLPAPFIDIYSSAVFVRGGVEFRSDEGSDDFWVGGHYLGQAVNGQVGLFVDTWHTTSDGLFDCALIDRWIL
jgi:hypothetical protein